MTGRERRCPHNSPCCQGFPQLRGDEETNSISGRGTVHRDTLPPPHVRQDNGTTRDSYEANPRSTRGETYAFRLAHLSLRVRSKVSGQTMDRCGVVS
jgi:hypothetical protein